MDIVRRSPSYGRFSKVRSGKTIKEKVKPLGLLLSVPTDIIIGLLAGWLLSFIACSHKERESQGTAGCWLDGWE